MTLFSLRLFTKGSWRFSFWYIMWVCAIYVLRYALACVFASYYWKGTNIRYAFSSSFTIFTILHFLRVFHHSIFFRKKKSIWYYVNTTLYNTKPTIFKKLCSDNLVTLFEFEVILFFQISKVSAMLASQFVIWIEDLNRIIWIEWRISLITLKRVVKSLPGFVVLARGKLKGIQIERT